MGERSYIKKLEYMRVGNWVVYKLLPFRCLHYPNLMLTPGNRGKRTLNLAGILCTINVPLILCIR